MEQKLTLLEAKVRGMKEQVGVFTTDILHTETRLEKLHVSEKELLKTIDDLREVDLISREKIEALKQKIYSLVREIYPEKEKERLQKDVLERERQVILKAEKDTLIKEKRLEPDEWWDTTDSLGGIRQCTADPNLYFLVSKSNLWDKEKEYIPPPGYRWITTGEGKQVFNNNIVSSYIFSQTQAVTYKNQGGWSGYVWNGRKRCYFIFSDSKFTNLAKHAGSYDNAALHSISQTNLIAGIVCRKI